MFTYTTDYKGCPIEVDEQRILWVNASKIAEAYKECPFEWIAKKSTKRLIKKLLKRNAFPKTMALHYHMQLINEPDRLYMHPMLAWKYAQTIDSMLADKIDVFTTTIETTKTIAI